MEYKLLMFQSEWRSIVDGTIVGLKDVRPVLYANKRIGQTSRIRVYWWYNGTILRMSILSYMRTKG